MDPRVIDAPFPIRWLIVHALILPTRPRHSAEAYRSIWTANGSPLIHLSQQLESRVRERLSIPVFLAMRYGNPGIRSTLSAILASMKDSLSELRLLPLYPQYAMSTFESVVVETRRNLKLLAPDIRLKVIQPFFRDPRYISSLAELVRPFLERGADHLLFSYHGLPERHLRKTDPTGHHCLIQPDCCSTPSPAHTFCYRHQAMETTRAVVKELGIDSDNVSHAYQSRLGRDKWLEPSTESELIRLGNAGTKNLAVLSPSFVTDCLETLEELGIRGRDTFRKAGGETMDLIPCLNVSPGWVETVTELIQDESAWKEDTP